MMKKLMALLTLLTVVFSFAACGSKEYSSAIQRIISNDGLIDAEDEEDDDEEKKRKKDKFKNN